MSIPNYASVLKYFIAITNIKMILIAKVVDYDISYVSKWCSNSNLPPKKNIDNINRKLAELLSSEIKKQNLTAKIAAEFHKETAPDATKEEVKKLVYHILTESYDHSYHIFYAKDSKKYENQTVIFGKNEIIDSIAKNISSAIESAADDIEMIFTPNILPLLKTGKYGLLNEKDFSNIKTKLYVSINMDCLEEDFFTNIKNLYKLLNNNVNITYTIFDNHCVQNMNTFVIKNKVAYLFIINNDGYMEMATVIYDKPTVNKIYQLVHNQISNNDILVKPEESECLEKGGFRTKFYTATQFNFFSCNGFEFLLPFDIIENGISKEAEQNFGKKMSLFVRTLQITWEEKFINANMNFYMPKSNILRYIEKGSIYYTDVHYTLSIAERQRHVRNIIDSMRKNLNINFYVIDDDYLHLKEDFFNISVFFNESRAFLKKTGSSIKNNSTWYYIVANDKLIEYLKLFFKELENEQYCLNYKVDEIDKIVEKNEKMMLRMLELKN